MKKPITYNLPKGYLSYSAAMCWLKNKEAFRRRYYMNEPSVESVPMRFGKKIAETLESRDYSEYPELKKVPYYPVSEQSIEVMIDGVLVKGYLDLYKPKTFTFGEVKTGSISHKNGPPWDRVKVAAHEQLPWYSLMIEEYFGKVDPLCHLIWVETRYKSTVDQVGSRMLEGEGRELELTGRIEIFPRRIAKWERQRIKKLIKQVAQEISDDYTEWLAKTPEARGTPGGQGDLREARIGVHAETPSEGRKEATRA